ncbi:MAG TPA: alpha-2-macroglobulin, partial [Nitrospiraceae bacterium]|nr:alpha-2-macroglobulin [Nitrospiraceae bacterium]
MLIFFFKSILVFADSVTIEFFSPQGTVKGVRQVSARFSEQMVTFGDPKIADPFEIKCPAKGVGRWADGKNWVYDFEKDLPAGLICTFTLKPDVKSISENGMAGQKEFTFSTGGPAILRSYPRDGAESIDEEQVFIFFTDALPKEESILANAWCQIEDINEPVGVEIIKGNERSRILNSVRFYNRRSWPSDHITLVKCRRNFPNEKSVEFVWGKGVESEGGVSTTQDQILTFKSRAPFTAQFRCDRENEASPCIPLLPMQIFFTSPVSVEQARRVVLKGEGKTYLPTLAEDEDYVRSMVFKGPFPENAEFEIELPSDLKDDAGRSLSNKDKYPLRVRTGPYPPLAKFAADFGIIEKSNPYLPVTVRNIEAQIKARMLEIYSGTPLMEKTKDSLTSTGSKMDDTPGKIMPKAEGGIEAALKGRIEQVDKEKDIIKSLVTFFSGTRPGRHAQLKQPGEDDREISFLRNDFRAKEFEIPMPTSEKSFDVIGIPLKKPGFYIVEVESLLLGKSLLGKPAPMYVASAALVSNMAVHFKWGRESSLIWVTSLDKAEPVQDAKVSVLDCDGKTYWQGKTGQDGTAFIKKHILPEADVPSCNYGRSGGLFVFARTADDLSFVNSRWTEGIEPWRFQLPTGYWDDNIAAHTIFDRTLFRAGETVHMKHVIRKKTGQGFAFLKKDELPTALKIEHYGTNQTYTLPITWDVANGIAENTWEIPKEANLGNYAVMFSTGRKKLWRMEDYQSGRFMVEEYKVPLMKGSIQPLADPIINKKEVDVDLQVRYLAGGSAQGLPVKLRHQAARKYLRFDDYKDFAFTNGEIKEGIVREREGRDEEDTGEQDEYLSPVKRKQMEKNISTVDLKLGEGGSVRAKLSDLPVQLYPQDLITELEYKDPNGQIQTVSKKIDLYPSKIIVGIRPNSWQTVQDSFGFQLAALDIKGKPIPNIEIKAEIFQKKRYSHRKRLIGGFYSYEHVTEIKKLGPICEGKTTANGLIICNSPAPVSGNLIIQAKATDADGNASVVSQDVWVMGKENLWFRVGDHERIDVIPERKKYEPGEKAKFQVRMPFREATALVTVEREGILDRYIMKISGKNPIIEVPIKKNYSPNIFVSVLCVRGRIGNIQPTALVDLGKPAYKLGITYINVGWRANELKVKVSADREVYKIRGRAHVMITVKKPDGRPASGEVAVAAVDQGLLELRPNESWNLLEEMMQRRSYEVQTSTAQMHIVGKRHFGLKALPQGGGGGRLPTRELFDTLLLWEGKVMLNNKGKASVEIPLNDSLTSFRIVAVATSGVNQFGTGQTSIRSSQDLMLLSGLPAMVREGDSFRAAFSVRNASNRSMDITVSGKYGSGQAENELPKIIEKLAPGEAKEASWFIKVPKGAESLAWDISATEAKGSGRDSVRINQKVLKAIPVRVFQSTLFQLDRQYNLQVERPKDSLPGRGGINVSLKPSITGGLDEVIEY